MGKDKTRDNLISVKMNDQEVALLDELASLYRLNRSDFLRYLLAKEGRELGREIPDRLEYETST